MSDGPFKNLKLDNRLKKFAEAVQNDTVPTDERCALGHHAIVYGVLSETPSLFNGLADYLNGSQLDFDPKSSIEGVFDAHPKSQFTDNFQKEVKLRLHDGASPENAISEGLDAAIQTHIDETRTRIQEACLDSHHKGEVRKDQLDRAIEGTDATLRELDTPKIRDALMRGDRDAFKNATKKKDGLDEGPAQ